MLAAPAAHFWAWGASHAQQTPAPGRCRGHNFCALLAEYTTQGPARARARTMLRPGHFTGPSASTYSMCLEGAKTGISIMRYIAQLLSAHLLTAWQPAPVLANSHMEYRELPTNVQPAIPIRDCSTVMAWGAPNIWKALSGPFNMAYAGSAGLLSVPVKTAAFVCIGQACP